MPTHSMEQQIKQSALPEEILLPIEDVWLNVIAQCETKWKLRETCAYFYHLASVENKKIFLQNPLIITIDPNCRTLQDYSTKYVCSIDRIRLLINQGASLMTPKGETPLLHGILGSGRTNEACAQIVKLLLSKGVDVNERESYTALGHACRFCRIEAISLLLAHPDIDINAIDDCGKTPLDYAIGKRDQHMSFEVSGRRNNAYKYNAITQLLTTHGAKRSRDLQTIEG